jgi:hypothetical protein
MKIYKTKLFHRWASGEGVDDASLRTAVAEMTQGLADALGGHVFKKRIPLPGRGKRGGARTLIAYRQGSVAVFMYGFSKNEQANIDNNELKVMRLLAKQLLSFSSADLVKAVNAGELREVN